MEIFEKIKEYIGQKVILYYYHGGNVFEITQELKGVEDYSNVTLANTSYPFINKVSGIGTITTLDGKVIYNNPIINEAYICKTDEEFEECKKQTFGEDYQEKKKAYNLQKHTVKPKSVN
ncbi:MAG: hypothetical protein IKZ96_02710 [Bacilli bacterium]|nr:hypothetical protein [Bacilli bacterium]